MDQRGSVYAPNEGSVVRYLSRALTWLFPLSQTLRSQLSSETTTTWKNASLQRIVLTDLKHVLMMEMRLGEGMPGVYVNAPGVVQDVWKFEENHSALVAAVALRFLVVLAPPAVEVMYFGELGPIDGRSFIVGTEGDVLIPCFPIGTYTARWQSTYAG